MLRGVNFASGGTGILDTTVKSSVMRLIRCCGLLSVTVFDDLMVAGRRCDPHGDTD